MNEINTLLIIDIVLIVLGLYLLKLALKMKKTKKVDRFVVAEEVLRYCKDEEAFADFLYKNMLVCAIVITIGGIVLVIHELFFDLGVFWYAICGAVALVLLWLFKSLADGKSKYCM